VAVQAALGLRNGPDLAATISGTDVRLMLCGHFHLQLFGMLSGLPVWVTPGVVTRIDLTATPGTERAVKGASASLIDLGGPNSPIFHTLHARDPHLGQTTRPQLSSAWTGRAPMPRPPRTQRLAQCGSPIVSPLAGPHHRRRPPRQTTSNLSDRTARHPGRRWRRNNPRAAALGDAPEQRRKLYNLNKACSADIPDRGPFYTYEEYVTQRIDVAAFNPKGVIVGNQGDGWIAISATFLHRLGPITIHGTEPNLRRVSVGFSATGFGVGLASLRLGATREDRSGLGSQPGCPVE
jgi:hypothetical protein